MGRLRVARTPPATCERVYQYAAFGVPGPRAATRARRRPRRRAVRDGARGDGGPGGRGAQLLPPPRPGALGEHGFYEALDFTPSRLAQGESVAVRAHVHGAPPGDERPRARGRARPRPMRARFHARPAVAATEPLLQERTPRGVALAEPRRDDVAVGRDVRTPVPPVVRRFTFPHPVRPVPPALPRQRLRDGDDERLRLEPLARPRRVEVARGRDPRRLGDVLLRARRGERRVLVGGVPAAGDRAVEPRGRLQRGPRGALPPRRHDRDAARGDRLLRERRRVPSRHRRQPRGTNPGAAR